MGAPSASSSSSSAGGGRRSLQRLPLLLPLLLLLLSPAVAFQRIISSTSISTSMTRMQALPSTSQHRLPIITKMPVTAAPFSSSTSSRPGSRQNHCTRLHAWPTGRDPRSFAKDFPLAAARVSITILGTVLTYVAHTNKRCSAILASSAVTLAGSLIAPGLGQATMCGSFTGMSSSALFPSVQWALGAGVLTSVLYEALIHAREAGLGLGGRSVVVLD